MKEALTEVIIQQITVSAKLEPVNGKFYPLIKFGDQYWCIDKGYNTAQEAIDCGNDKRNIILNNINRMANNINAGLRRTSRPKPSN